MSETKNTAAKTTEARLMSYVWHSYFDESQDKRVSDWDLAEECETCGRKIVHVYVVVTAEGAAVTVGKECAHIRLGWGRKDSKRLERETCRLMAEERERKALQAEALENVEKFSQDSSESALEGFRARNAIALKNHVARWGFEYVPVVYTSAGRFYATLADPQRTGALEAIGWERVA